MRDFSVDITAALARNEVYMAILAEFDFASGAQYFWAGPEGQSLSYDGKVWNSIADLGSIDKISQAQNLQDSRTTISLRVNSERVTEIGADDSRGRDAAIELLFLTPDAAHIGSLRFPKTMGEIRVNAAVSTDGGGKRQVIENVQLELLDKTAIISRQQFTRMTYETALRIDPDDHGLEFVSDPTAINLGIVADNRVADPSPNYNGDF